MMSTSNRQRSKSTKRLQVKSPLGFKNKIDISDKSPLKKIFHQKSPAGLLNIQQQKNTGNGMKCSGKPNTSQKKVTGNSWNSSQNFKNKLLVSSHQFNRLKNQFKTSSNSLKGSLKSSQKQGKKKKIKIKILDHMQKKTSCMNSDKANTNDNSNNSSESEQIIQLKMQNQHFKKIYDDALGQLKKLQVQLKQEKKVHDVQKHIYQTKLNKLKRMFNNDKESVSHIIFDDQERCIVVMQNNQNQQLGIYSDQDDQHEDSLGDLSIESR